MDAGFSHGASMPTALSTIPHIYNNILILQRGDGYWNATAMCRANGKLWGNYWRNQETQEFLAELASVMRIRITELVQVRQGGEPTLQGTWVHRRVAIHLANGVAPASPSASTDGWRNCCFLAGLNWPPNNQRSNRTRPA